MESIIADLPLAAQILLFGIFASPTLPLAKFLIGQLYKQYHRLRWNRVNATRFESLKSSLEAKQFPFKTSHTKQSWELDVNGYRIHPRGRLIDLELPTQLDFPWLTIQDTRLSKSAPESVHTPNNATDPSEHTGDWDIDNRFNIFCTDPRMAALLTHRIRCLLNSFDLFELTPNRISVGGTISGKTLDHMLEIAGFLQKTDPVDAVLENLSDPNLEVRRQSLKLIPLCDLEPQLKDQTLIAFLDDADPLCRALAAKLLNIHDQEMIAELLGDPKLTQATAEVILDMLKNSEDPSALQVIRQMLGQDNISENLLRNAAGHLSKVKDTATIPYLRDAISRTEDPHTKAALITALGKFHSPESGQFLMDCLEELSYSPSRDLLRTTGKNRDLIIIILAALCRCGHVDLIPRLRHWNKRMLGSYSTEVQEALIYIKAGTAHVGNGALTMMDDTDQAGALAMTGKIPNQGLLSIAAAGGGELSNPAVDNAEELADKP